MPDWCEKYQKKQQIGQGTYGKIFKILKKDTKQILAAKIISIDIAKDQYHNIEQQIQIMNKCTHTNIVEFLGVELFAGQVWILMQFCQNGSLSDIMKKKQKPFKEIEVRDIMKQILEGLIYIHQHDIVHRDIKAANLLFHRGVVKIADFGVSFINKKDKIIQYKFNRIGSPYWMSPEVLSDSIYNEKTDIWALGITAIQLSQGEPPFSHQHPFRAIYSIQTHPPEGIKVPNNFSPQLNSFIKQCLTLDYKKRPTAKSLLNHKFITQQLFVTSVFHSPISERIQNQENQNDETIIMHDGIPKSIWQKQSYPQSQEKRQFKQECETVIIKESSNKEQNLQLINHFGNLFQNKNQVLFTNKDISIEERNLQVQLLYAKMQNQIKQVRRRYMQKIQSLYKNDKNKQNLQQNNISTKQKNKKVIQGSNILINYMSMNKHY